MQKFIVTGDGLLRFGDVNMHKDLLQSDECCIGGGEYAFDYIGNKMLLSGRSYDFGRVKWDRVDKLRIPSSLAGMDIYYEDILINGFAEVVYV